MSSSKRFTNPEFLGQLGKALLLRLVQQFANKFAAQGTLPPSESLDEKDYFKELAVIGISKKGFPAAMTDVLYGIVDLADEDGKSRLIHAMPASQFAGHGTHKATCEEFALHCYLANSAIFEKKVEETRILARSSFHVFGSGEPNSQGTAFSMSFSYRSP